MKPSLFIFTFLVFLSTSCRHEEILTFTNSKQNQVIALQPLDSFDVSSIQAVVNEINSFYHKKIIVLNSVNIPEAWYNGNVYMYFADSIISYLSKLHENDVVEIIGLTHKHLYTIKENAFRSYFDTNIFGLGYQPGKACVVSDGSIGRNDTTLFNHYLRNIIFHEIGHNMGLSHCKDPNCFMSEKNDNANDYCKSCKRKLMR